MEASTALDGAVDCYIVGTVVHTVVAAALLVSVVPGDFFNRLI